LDCLSTASQPTCTYELVILGFCVGGAVGTGEGGEAAGIRELPTVTARQCSPGGKRWE